MYTSFSKEEKYENLRAWIWVVWVRKLTSAIPCSMQLFLLYIIKTYFSWKNRMWLLAVETQKSKRSLPCFIAWHSGEIKKCRAEWQYNKLLRNKCGWKDFFAFWNSMCNSIMELWYPSKPSQAKQELLRSFQKNQHFLCHYPIIENVTKISILVPKYNSMPQYNPPPDSWHAIKQLYSNCFFRKYNELNLTWWFISITSYWFPVII